MNLACYQYSIGLSRNSCNCGGAPAFYNRSDSGLYLDELGNLGSTLGGYDDCGPGGMWQALTRARERGILAFIATTNGLISKMGKVKRANFSGALHHGYLRDLVDPTKAYAGFSILCAPLRSGYMRINGFGANFTHTGTVTLTIYKRTNPRSDDVIDLEQVGSAITLNTVANKATTTTLATAVTLPLYDANVPQAEYFLIYETDGLNAKQNEFYCPTGCGGLRPYYSEYQSPCFVGHGQYQGTKAWANWVTIAGFEADTLTSPDKPNPTRNYGNGIYPNLDIYCSPAAILCSGALDFTTNPFAGEVAEAILLASGTKLVEDNLLSTSLQNTLQANREAFAKFLPKWEKLFYDRAEYIATNVDLTESDCLECKPKIGLRTRAVLS